MKHTTLLTIISLLILTAAASAKEPAIRRGRVQPQPETKDLGQVKMSDVFKIRSENGRLVFSTGLAAKVHSTFTARIDGMSGTCKIHLYSDGQTLHSFTFSCPGKVTHSVNWSFGSLSLSVQKQSDNGQHTVSLHQQNSGGRFDGAAPQQIRLVVHSMDPQAGSMVNINHFATDLVQLRRQYPDDFNRYVRPLLRELQLNALLAADPLVAFQVFANQMEPDAKMAAAVEELVPKLDSDSFPVREAAVMKLKELGMPAAIPLCRIDRSALSAQQNVLLDNVLGPFRPRPVAEANRLREDVDFLLDCLYTDEPTIRQAALEHLKKAVGKEIDFDLGAAGESRGVAIDNLRTFIKTGSTTRPSKS